MGENERFVKSNYSNAVVERDGALFFCSIGVGLLRKDLGAGYTGCAIIVDFMLPRIILLVN